jgi:formate-dependent nitrite reductase membrane component NrfD
MLKPVWCILEALQLQLVGGLCLISKYVYQDYKLEISFNTGISFLKCVALYAALLFLSVTLTRPLCVIAILLSSHIEHGFMTAALALTDLSITYRVDSGKGLKGVPF